jgi:hypothetical protein
VFGSGELTGSLCDDAFVVTVALADRLEDRTRVSTCLVFVVAGSAEASAVLY